MSRPHTPSGQARAREAAQREAELKKAAEAKLREELARLKAQNANLRNRTSVTALAAAQETIVAAKEAEKETEKEAAKEAEKEAEKEAGGEAGGGAKKETAAGKGGGAAAAKEGTAGKETGAAASAMRRASMAPKAVVKKAESVVGMDSSETTNVCQDTSAHRDAASTT